MSSFALSFYMLYGNVEIFNIPTSSFNDNTDFILSAVSEYSGRRVGMSAPVHVSPDGEIIWYSNFIIKTYCKMKVRYFPFDEQFCPIKLSSWSHNETEVVLRYDEGVSNLLQNYSGL